MPKNPHHQRIAESLAPALLSLTHPGNGKSGPVAVNMPGFSTGGGMPEKLADAVRASTKPVAEAIVHTITEVWGNSILPTSELDQLIAAATANTAALPERTPEVLSVRCAACQEHLFDLPPMFLDAPTLNPLSLKHLKKALARIPDECTHRQAAQA